MANFSSSSHIWTFFRTGGIDQVALNSGADLVNLEHLDQKLWVALSCPVKGLEIDEKTLALIDADGDGRIRVPELLAAVKWAAAHLNNPSELLAGFDRLAISSINTSTPGGSVLQASAEKKGGKVTATYIGGRCVPMMSGIIDLA